MATETHDDDPFDVAEELLREIVWPNEDDPHLIASVAQTHALIGIGREMQAARRRVRVVAEGES